MINSQMKTYNYFLYKDADEYGQEQLTKDVQGTIKISINLTSQSVQDNIKYKDCGYIGLTFDAKVNDAYVIEYGEELLKVLYVTTTGRYKQVFLKNI